MEQVKDLQNIFNGYVEKFSENETKAPEYEDMNQELKDFKSIVNINDEAFHILYDNYLKGCQLEIENNETYWEAVYKHVTKEPFEDKVLFFEDNNEYFKKTVKEVIEMAETFESEFDEDESIEVNSIRQSLRVLNENHNIRVVTLEEFRANATDEEKRDYFKDVNGIRIEGSMY